MISFGDHLPADNGREASSSETADNRRKAFSTIWRYSLIQSDISNPYPNFHTRFRTHFPTFTSLVGPLALQSNEMPGPEHVTVNLNQPVMNLGGKTQDESNLERGDDSAEQRHDRS